jgi:hypothetical protein
LCDTEKGKSNEGQTADGEDLREIASQTAHQDRTCDQNEDRDNDVVTEPGTDACGVDIGCLGEQVDGFGGHGRQIDDR